MFRTHIKRRCYWLSVTLLIVLLDQLTKFLALHYLILNQAKVVTNFFNLTLLFNRGAAFSLLSQAGGWQQWFLGALTVVVSVVILGWLLRLPVNRVGAALGLSLILGGAIGNLLDRIFRGAVIDFLDFHIQQYHWYVFNIADAAITVGAIVLAIELLRQSPSHPSRSG